MRNVEFVRRWLALVLLLLAAGAALAQRPAQSQPFDHLRTGFPLTGEHARVRCESCHLDGVFKGTPRDCASCHLSGMRYARSNVVMPLQHPPTQASCDACHTTTTFVGAKFAHTGVAPGACQSCHNGKTAPGKPDGHIPTHASCDSCHRTTAWVPAAKFDHAGVTPGTCASCHNGSRAKGRSAQHMPTASAQSCDDCHRTTSAWRPTAWNHTQVAVAGQCASCHSGAYPPADGRPANHVPYQTIAAAASANCDSCHKGNFGSWANGRFHANFSVTTGCANCHGGGFLAATGKPATPVHNGVTNCESCHSTGGWAGAKVDHASFNASTNCAQCHGSSASGKPPGHMPTTANCFACHNVAPAKWTPSKWNHTQVAVAGQCASCHTGGYPPADGRPTNHIPYQSVAASASANCDACHKGSFTSWANGAFHANYSVATGCFGCHTGAYLNAAGKPNTPTHATVTGNCESCHKSTTSWAASIDHSTFTAATNCAQCHGVTASGKLAAHLPTTANCFLCHNVAPAKWTPTKWNHTQLPVTAQCASCHTGGYPPADGRPGNHIPYQSVAVSASANCDGCHKGSFTSWANGQFHANYSVTTGCFSCHTGAYLNAVGKPNTAIHANVTGNCDSCHKSTTSWAASIDHSTFTAATNCAQCHGVTASGKPATHIPTTANCFLCHNVAPAKWTPTKWNHTQLPVTSQCASCHTGGYPPADGRPPNHIPYQTVAVSATANCDACHRGSFTTWANGRLHSYYSVGSGCFSCHTGAYLAAVGKPNTATHATVTGNCESCHKSTTSWAASVDHSTFTAATNCAQCHGVTASGKPATHIPTTANCFLCHSVAPARWTPTKWNHTQLPVTSQCASCHTGGYPPADGRPANHIPYQLVPVTTTANCDGCHKGSTTTWANGRLHLYYSVTTGCFSCHTGAYLAAVGKPNTATHATVTGNCESCHKSTTSWAASVDHSTFTAATNCAQCHGVTASGKPATHIPTTANCFLCHNVAPARWTPTKWNHTQFPVANQCASCHTGGYPPADGRPANHIPYQTVPASATANCDGCHRGSTTSWANGKFHMYYSVSTGCKNCHTGAYLNARGKPSNHIPEVQLLNGASMDCNACHTSTSGWSAVMNHNGSLGNGAGWCKACHQSGTSWLGSMERMPLTHKSATAVDCSQSGCHRPLGTKGTPYTQWD